MAPWNSPDQRKAVEVKVVYQYYPMIFQAFSTIQPVVFHQISEPSTVPETQHLDFKHACCNIWSSLVVILLKFPENSMLGLESQPSTDHLRPRSWTAKNGKPEMMLGCTWRMGSLWMVQCLITMVIVIVPFKTSSCRTPFQTNGRCTWLFSMGGPS